MKLNEFTFMCDVCGSKLKSTYARIQRRHNRTVVQYIEKRNTFNTLIIAHWYVCEERRWWRRRRRRNNAMNNEYISSIGSADTQIKSHLKKNPQEKNCNQCVITLSNAVLIWRREKLPQKNRQEKQPAQIKNFKSL